ncbi:unnamed protein product [Sphagnum jensenii]
MQRCKADQSNTCMHERRSSHRHDWARCSIWQVFPSGKKDFFNDPATVVTKELDVVLPSGKKRTHGTSTACHLLV